MSSFIHGILVQNKDGATYEGEVYDRDLQLQLAQGPALTVFDPTPTISTDLSLKEPYEVLLAAITISIVPVTDQSQALKPDEWEGTISQLAWQAPPNTYKRARTRLYSRSWTLLDTLYGQILMSSKQIKEPLKVGDRIRWSNMRFDLYAVV